MMMNYHEYTVSRDDEAIRSRLLYSLGIVKPTPESQAAATAAANAARTANGAVVTLLSNDAPIHRSLNDKEERIKRGHHVRKPSRQRLVRFNSIVKEKPIPSQSRYSDRIKRTIWSDQEEINENAYRNQIEYQAEGMKWESVLEDDEMYADAETGETIHPVWVENEEYASMLFS